jgi:hypothetical protein
MAVVFEESVQEADRQNTVAGEQQRDSTRHREPGERLGGPDLKGRPAIPAVQQTSVAGVVAKHEHVGVRGMLGNAGQPLGVVGLHVRGEAEASRERGQRCRDAQRAK